MDPKFVELKTFGPSIFLDLYFFVSSKFLTRNILDLIFSNPYYMDQHFFGPKSFWTHFLLTYVFLNMKFFGTLNFWTNFLDLEFLSDLKDFWLQNPVNKISFGQPFFFSLRMFKDSKFWVDLISYLISWC